MADEEKVKEKIKICKETYFKLNDTRYEFTKQRYTAIMQILVIAFGFMPFVLDKLEVVSAFRIVLDFFINNSSYEFNVFRVTASIFIVFILAYVCLIIYAIHSVIKYLQDYELFFDKLSEMNNCDMQLLNGNFDGENAEQEKQERKLLESQSQYRNEACSVRTRCESRNNSIPKIVTLIFVLMACCFLCGIIFRTLINKDLI
ncbi:hypothetical protein KVC56_06325 [Helicobacter pylori]|nr:hypothetical protein KVC56_06325 [Helicobacter pylori]